MKFPRATLLFTVEVLRLFGAVRYSVLFVMHIKTECLRHFVFFGERHLRYVIREYVTHYNEKRFHQGIGGLRIRPTAANDNASVVEINRRSRLGGLSNFYYRDAA